MESSHLITQLQLLSASCPENSLLTASQLPEPQIPRVHPTQNSHLLQQTNAQSIKTEFSAQQELCVPLKAEDNMDIVRPEKGMFSSGEEDDESTKAVKQAVEAVSKAFGPITDSLRSHSVSCRKNTDLQVHSQNAELTKVPSRHQTFTNTNQTSLGSTEESPDRAERVPEICGKRGGKRVHGRGGKSQAGPVEDAGDVHLERTGSQSQPNTCNDNEELMDLHIQFQQPKSAPITRAMLAVKKHRKVKHTHASTVKKRGRKARLAKTPPEIHKVLRLNMTGEMFERWSRVGTVKELSTNTAIALFLLQQYEKNQETCCSDCESPLVLCCMKCQLPPSAENSTFSETESAADDSPSRLSSADNDDNSQDTEETVEDTCVQLDTAEEDEASPRKRQRRGGRRQVPYVCKECGSEFTRPGGLKVHMRIHTGEKPYKCDQCGVAFAQSGQLTVHIRKHKGERPFVCEECGSSFPLSGSLKQHMRIHTGEKPFSCSHCDKQFSYAGDLTVHLRKHSGDKPFLCQDCGKAFAVSSDLTKHKKIHSGDKPFPCSECGKAFAFLNRLTAHMRTHTGDKPFLCQECGAAFSRASNLTVHKRVHHTFEKPFKCPECGVAFSDSANLSKHKKNKHRKENKLSVSDTKLAVQCSPPALSKVDSHAPSGSDIVSGSLVTPTSSGPSIFPYYNYYYCQQQQQPHQYLEPSSG